MAKRKRKAPEPPSARDLRRHGSLLGALLVAVLVMLAASYYVGHGGPGIGRAETSKAPAVAVCLAVLFAVMLLGRSAAVAFAVAVLVGIGLVWGGATPALGKGMASLGASLPSVKDASTPDCPVGRIERPDGVCVAKPKCPAAKPAITWNGTRAVCAKES